MRHPSLMFSIPAAAGLLAAGVVLAGCSSPSSGSTPTSSAATTGSPSGARQAIAACLRDHGADPTLLTGLLAGGSPDLSSSELSALRTAGTACVSSVSASLEVSLAKVVTCLNGEGYHLDASSPLVALLSLDLNSAATDAAVKACTSRLSAGSAPASAS